MTDLFGETDLQALKERRLLEKSNSKPSGSFYSGLQNPPRIIPLQLPLIVTALALPEVYCQFHYVTKEHTLCRCIRKGVKDYERK